MGGVDVQEDFDWLKGNHLAPFFGEFGLEGRTRS